MTATPPTASKKIASNPIQDWFLEKRRPKSVFFYTFHKSASTLFSNFVLKQFQGLEHIDYAQEIYEGNLKRQTEIEFAKRGGIYGPLRLSLVPPKGVVASHVPEFHWLVRDTATIEFVRRRRCIFFVRDPRDIIISSYFSFLDSHGESPVAEIAQTQQKHRQTIAEQGMAEYAEKFSERLRFKFEVASQLLKASKNSLLLRYEDMVDDWEVFAKGLKRFVRIDPAALEELRSQSRPPEVVDAGRHQRSGKTRQYLEHFDEATLSKVNETLSGVLRSFRYAQ
ncbi:MAG: sulfotransferase domain-containing protein [Verrucomicrobiota bacterium]